MIPSGSKADRVPIADGGLPDATVAVVGRPDLCSPGLCNVTAHGSRDRDVVPGGVDAKKRHPDMGIFKVVPSRVAQRRLSLGRQPSHQRYLVDRTFDTAVCIHVESDFSKRSQRLGTFTSL